MPESIVPLVALLAGGDNPDINAAIGVGAILGAPLMLSTLSLSLMGLSVVRKRGLRGHLRPERSGLERDLAFFLTDFGIALAALFVPTRLDWLRAVRRVLVLTYFVWRCSHWAYRRTGENGHGTQAHARCICTGSAWPTTRRSSFPVAVRWCCYRGRRACGVEEA
jgi:cation:H+ antiporter